MNRPQNLPTAFACPITIPMENEIIHTVFHPFCDDPDCPCHFMINDDAYRRQIGDPITNGLLTEQEANRILYDKQV